MERHHTSENAFILLLRIFAATIMVLAALIAGLFFFRISALYGLNLWLCLIPSVLILLLIPVLFVRRRLPLLLAWCILSAAAMLPAGISLQTAFLDTITKDTDPPFDPTPYLPFQTQYTNTEDFSYYYHGAWALGYWDELDGAEIQLTEDLPVLDGIPYAFRLYSAIVNAVYPETTTRYGEDFKISGEADGFRGLLDKTVDIYFGLEPTQAQLDAANKAGIELVVTPIAHVNWNVIIHPDNPVKSLYESQIRAIFSGEITNWSQVGGKDEPILVYQNEPGSFPQQLLERFMGDKPLMDAATSFSFRMESGLTEQITKYRNYPNAIGFSHTYPEDTKTLPVIKDGAGEKNREHTDFHIPLCAITRKDSENENVSTLLNFLCSPAGQYIVLRAGYSNYYYTWADAEENIPQGEIINTAPNIDLNLYMPFKGTSRIVRLQDTASLRLQDSLPRIDGAAAVFPVYSAFVNAVYPISTRLYNNDTQVYDTLPDYFVFNYSNTVKGYKYLAQKDTDIFFGGYPSAEQIAYAQDQGTQFVYTPIGYEAFVFFVHKDNPIDSLTTEQLKGIYSGQITNWSQVGGHDEEIVAFQRNPGSGSQSRLIRFMGDTPLMKAPGHTLVDTMMGITESVYNYRSSTASIGFSFRYYVETLVDNPELKLLAIDGIAPTLENIQNGTYPEIGYLYAVTWEGNENENVQKLLDWILSPEGQYIIRETGYTPIH